MKYFFSFLGFYFKKIIEFLSKFSFKRIFTPLIKGFLTVLGVTDRKLALILKTLSVSFGFFRFTNALLGLLIFINIYDFSHILSFQGIYESFVSFFELLKDNLNKAILKFFPDSKGIKPVETFIEKTEGSVKSRFSEISEKVTEKYHQIEESIKEQFESLRKTYVKPRPELNDSIPSPDDIIAHSFIYNLFHDWLFWLGIVLFIFLIGGLFYFDNPVKDCFKSHDYRRDSHGDILRSEDSLFRRIFINPIKRLFGYSNNPDPSTPQYRTTLHSDLDNTPDHPSTFTPGIIERRNVWFKSVFGKDKGKGKEVVRDLEQGATPDLNIPTPPTDTPSSVLGSVRRFFRSSDTSPLQHKTVKKVDDSQLESKFSVGEASETETVDLQAPEASTSSSSANINPSNVRVRHPETTSVNYVDPFADIRNNSLNSNIDDWSQNFPVSHSESSDGAWFDQLQERKNAREAKNLLNTILNPLMDEESDYDGDSSSIADSNVDDNSSLTNDTPGLTTDNESESDSSSVFDDDNPWFN